MSFHLQSPLQAVEVMTVTQAVQEVVIKNMEEVALGKILDMDHQEVQEDFPTGETKRVFVYCCLGVYQQPPPKPPERSAQNNIRFTRIYDKQEMYLQSIILILNNLQSGSICL